MTDYAHHKKIILEAIEQSSDIISSNFDNLTSIESKNEYKEVVTDLDFKSEKKILEILNAEFPDYNVYSEESDNKDQGSSYTWVIDPLDGTANLALGLPIIGISIALLKDNDVVLGVVHHVIRKKSYIAIQGQGSFLDDKPINVSTTDSIKSAHIGHIVSYEEKYKARAINTVTTLRSQCRRLLDTWAPAVEWSLLASGKLDALVSLGSEMYDKMAGTLLVAEAGGIITDLNGNPADTYNEDYLVASNNTTLHAQLLEALSQHYS